MRIQFQGNISGQSLSLTLPLVLPVLVREGAKLMPLPEHTNFLVRILSNATNFMSLASIPQSRFHISI